MTDPQLLNQILKMIADSIVDTVKETGPSGAPGGHIYAALMAHGCTLAQYEGIMSGLIQAKKLLKNCIQDFVKLLNSLQN